jgi:hypothetical protein
MARGFGSGVYDNSGSVVLFGLLFLGVRGEIGLS